MTDDNLLARLDALTLAVHELAYAQAATAANIARAAGLEACPEDYLPGNPRKEQPPRARPNLD